MPDTIRLFFATIASILLASAHAVHYAITVLLVLFFIDMAACILTVLFVYKKRINAKEFLFSFIYVAIYISIITGIHFVGERMDDELESLFIVKMITYVFVYFYGVNILSNLRIMFPENRAIKFLDYYFGLQFMKYLPTLGTFLNHEKKQETEQTEQTEQTEETDKTENQ